MKMIESWITWKNGDDVMMQAREPEKHGCGMLVFKANGDVQALYSEAAQIKKDYGNARAKARATKPAKSKSDESGVHFDDGFAFVDHLMRLQSQGIDFAALASDPHSDNSHRYLVNGFAADAWRLLAMIARGDSDGLARIAGLVALRKRIASIPPKRTELKGIASDIELAAASRRDETGEIKPPLFSEVIAVSDKRLKGREELTDIRRKITEAGFAWLPKKWTRKA
jgi:hypothetical protein